MMRFISRVALPACVVVVPGVVAQAAPDSAGFVTRLGADTLVVERFVRTARRLEAEVVLRVPRTTRTRYVVEFDAAGALVRMESRTFAADGAGAPLLQETVTRDGDSLRVETVSPDARRTRAVAADPVTLPFIDMVHWPFELVLMRARAAGAEQVAAPLLTGGRVQAFPVARSGPDSMTVTHPLRGTMRAAVDGQGRLLGLDAAATTRKLVVQRAGWLDLEGPAAAWAAADAAGRGVGALSGRAQVAASVAGAAITVDHGTPARRGRPIWGALVPFGQVWRTGANQATGFTTDRTLVLGSGRDTLVVPAGAYTLFSIPDRDGGVLIVNGQTGQAGTAYDAAQDLGRVPLSARPLADPVEVFTIAVTPSGEGGLLRLQWDVTELVVAFRVLP
jgi:hypothetical protein